jgi:hypothetical protein
MRPYLALVVLSFLYAPLRPAAAHEGFLDAYGCHYNEVQRTYHCHAGPLAGKNFKSREEMLGALKERERQENSRSRVQEQR